MCNSFPKCSFNCKSCKEYTPSEPKDEMQEYLEELDADNYLASIECFELPFLDSNIQHKNALFPIYPLVY